MHRERKIPPDNTQKRAVILLEFTNYLSHSGARWTLEVAEFLQCDRRAGLAANMQRLRSTFTGRWSRYAATRNSALLRTTEYRSSADREHRNRGDDDKRKIALHGKAPQLVGCWMSDVGCSPRGSPSTAKAGWMFSLFIGELFIFLRFLISR